jgi:hypothetical protein
MNSPASHLPRPLVAGIGFVSSIPALVAQLPGRLPGIAITSAIEARTKYLEYLRAGEAFLGGSDSGTASRGTDRDSVPDSVRDEAPVGPPAAVPTTAQDTVRPIAQAAFDRAPADPNPDAADLPIENYDGLSLASIRARLPRLDSVDVRDLIDYETAHAARLPVLTMLENRLAKLADD